MPGPISTARKGVDELREKLPERHLDVAQQAQQLVAEEPGNSTPVNLRDFSELSRDRIAEGRVYRSSQFIRCGLMFLASAVMPAFRGRH